MESGDVERIVCVGPTAGLERDGTSIICTAPHHDLIEGQEASSPSRRVGRLRANYEIGSVRRSDPTFGRKIRRTSHVARAGVTKTLLPLGC